MRQPAGTPGASASSNLAWSVYRNAEERPDAIALNVEGRTLTYSELRVSAQQVAGWLLARTSNGPVGRVAIFARRSLETYLGILGACWAGGTYVPINPTLPEARLAQMLEAVEPEAIVVDRRHLPLLTARLRAAAPVLAPCFTPVSGGESAADGEALPPYDPRDVPRPVPPEHVGYIVFTSGTTGVPKGVVVPVRAVAAFVEAVRALFVVGPEDRTAGMSEITFDISVFDMFFTWDRGAALYVVPAAQAMAPLSYLREQSITVLFGVPSLLRVLARMKLLHPGALPELRVSIFAGEPLPVALAESWSSAAPGSLVENFYGPTEAAVSCSRQRFEPGGPNPSARGIVSIGHPLPGTRLLVMGGDRRALPPGQAGELAIAGVQLALGYHRDAERTAQKFVRLDGERWYLTGDQAMTDADGRLFFLGRLDNQVKVRGHRVELEEVEAHLRAISGVEAVAVVAWPVRDGSADGLVAFLAGELDDRVAGLRNALRARLPPHMVPAAIHIVDALPLTANGKVDRKALQAGLEPPPA
ncbi:MAG TPA: amino acid adenylation domain-containing protein [Polyangia bacterium]